MNRRQMLGAIPAALVLPALPRSPDEVARGSNWVRYRFRWGPDNEVYAIVLYDEPSRWVYELNGQEIASALRPEGGRHTDALRALHAQRPDVLDQDQEDDIDFIAGFVVGLLRAKGRS